MQRTSSLPLKNLTKEQTLAESVEVAKSFEDRARGLLGRQGLPQGHCLWIDPCRSIHTFFMKFTIDVIFVDQKLKVTAVKRNIPKWRLAWGGLKAKSCFEFNAHSLNEFQVEKGDILYVGN